MGTLNYKELTAPAAEPVTLELAKQQLVVADSFTDDDNLITGYIIAARQHVENLMNRAIFNRSMQRTLDFFPCSDSTSTVNPNDRNCMFGTYWHRLAIKLPKPGCVSVESITYVDQTGALQTLDPSLYYVDVNCEPGRIVPKPGLFWPYSQAYMPGSVCVNYTAGTYGDGVEDNTCPQTIIQAMLLLISHFYSNRDATAISIPKAIEFGVEALLAGDVFDTFGMVS
jgi:hypothetical protein